VTDDRRHGTVFIAEDIGAPSPPRFSGYWEAEPDGPPAVLEQMPRTADLGQAIDWGRARAEIVLVRVVGRDYFTAGVRDPAGDLSRWPPNSSILAEIEEERGQLARGLLP